MCNISTKEKIQSLRREKRWTQQQLADMLRISRATVANWETGRVEPSLESLLRLSRVLETSPTYFLDRNAHDLATYKVRDDRFHFLNIQSGDLLFYKPTNMPKRNALMLYVKQGEICLCRAEYYQGHYYARISAAETVAADRLSWIGRVLRLSRDL